MDIRIFAIISSIILLLLLLNLCKYQFTTIQIFISVVILVIIFFTFFVMSFVAKKSIPIVLVVFVFIMFIANLIADSINSNNSNETIESLTMGSDLGTDQTTIGYAREVEHSGTSNALNTNSTQLNWLQAEADTASQQCQRLNDIDGEISSLTGFVPQQGICYTEDGEPGQRLIGSGDTCMPFGEDDTATTCEYGEDYQQTEMGEEEGDSCVPCPSSVNCYDCSKNFDVECLKYGTNYGVKSIEKCSSPYQDKCRATCGDGYFDGELLSPDSFMTPCYDKNVDLNVICRGLADENNYENFQRFGVYEYRSCPRRDQQRAQCKRFYNDTFPTHPLNATDCVTTDRVQELPGMCLNNDSSFVAFDLGAYDCPLGQIRANCAPQSEINKMKSNSVFSGNTYA